MEFNIDVFPVDKFILLKKVYDLRDSHIIPKLSRASLSEGKGLPNNVQIPPNGSFTKESSLIMENLIIDVRIDIFPCLPDGFKN